MSSCSHNHDHKHGHHHAHHGGGHHHHAPTTFGKAFALTLLINVLYVIGECIGAGITHSLSLLADAGHNLVDMLSLIAAWIAHILARGKARGTRTYGWQKMTILTALANGLILVTVTGFLIYLGILHLFRPEHVHGLPAALIILGGVCINIASALLLLKSSKEDLNVKGAFLHLLGDAAFGAGILVADLLIYFTGWDVLDPVISIAVGILILISACKMVAQSLHLAVDGAPPSIDLDRVLEDLKTLRGVTDAHHLHIWSLSTQTTALTAHLVIEDWSSAETVAQNAREILETRYKILHSTLQFETNPCSQKCVNHD